MALTLESLGSILDEIRCPGYALRYSTMGKGYYLQVAHWEPDIETGESREQRGRKWYVSPYATRGEVVQTALKATLAYAEHEIRERFTYQGARIFGPHFDLDALVALARGGNTEERP